ncbi:hypothetical protein [Actinophytocola oryzae]|uniref:Uncharacterized protein n=1 Tax=Actinophytocola oryzae TaxID=502181 RepID=A0A4R7W4E2_9PSEU|nr:hypothetical protein [Actinophytocola oryzae]TDV56497.1 hypothetical protein CLV71_102564 [Actinophytocola oryzae]
MDVDSRVTGVAKAVVAELAPDELVFFDTATEMFFRDRSKPARRQGRDPLSFGITEVVDVVTPAALYVAAVVVDEVLGRAASKTVDKVGGRWLRRKRVEGRPDEAPLLVSDPEQLAAICVEVRRLLRALHFPEDRIEVFVRALVGALTVPRGVFEHDERGPDANE